MFIDDNFLYNCIILLYALFCNVYDFFTNDCLPSSKELL